MDEPLVSPRRTTITTPSSTLARIGVVIGMMVVLGLWSASDSVRGYQKDLLSDESRMEQQLFVKPSDIEHPISLSAEQPYIIEHMNTTGTEAVIATSDATKILVSNTSSTPVSRTPTTTVVKTNSTPTSSRTTLEYFLAHIPKAGGYYVFRTLKKFLDQAPDIKASVQERWKLPKEEQHTIPVDGFCNQAARHHVSDFAKTLRGRQCTIHMNELWPVDLPRTNIAHKYTVVRDPISHVLSMYFHCTESTDHAKRALFMPSLDEWLQAWANARTNKTKAAENQSFRCYKPLDFQSNYLEFNPAKGQEKDFLKESFDILGDFGRIQQSICAIYIKYNKGNHIPKECDCTNARRRRLHDHGVTHHGSTFNVTYAQRSLILDHIRPTEVELYSIVQEVFQEQVRKLEEQHNFTMCEIFRE